VSVIVGKSENQFEEGVFLNRKADLNPDEDEHEREVAAPTA
jgi:hypothetical protein